MEKQCVCLNLICISFDALIQRYEPPEGRNRWDAPLFELTPNDELPLEQIADYLANKRPPPPNKSTVNVSLNINYSDINNLFRISYQYRIQIFYMMLIVLLKMFLMYVDKHK